MAEPTKRVIKISFTGGDVVETIGATVLFRKGLVLVSYLQKSWLDIWPKRKDTWWTVDVTTLPDKPDNIIIDVEDVQRKNAKLTVEFPSGRVAETTLMQVVPPTQYQVNIAPEDLVPASTGFKIGVGGLVALLVAMVALSRGKK